MLPFLSYILIFSLNIDKVFGFLLNINRDIFTHPHIFSSSAIWYTTPVRSITSSTYRLFMTKSEFNMVPQTFEKVDEAIVFKDYDEKWHKEAVINICTRVYDGRDYLPRMIDQFAASPVDFPMVLCRNSQDVTAVGNLQLMNTELSWIQVRVSDLMNHRSNRIFDRIHVH